MENNQFNKKMEILGPLDFDRIRQRIQLTDFIPLYGTFKHFDRYGDDQSLTVYNLMNRIDDSIFLFAYNFLIGKILIESYFNIWTK